MKKSKNGVVPKRYPQSLEDVTRPLVKPFFNKQGFLNGSIIEDWPLIVGAAYAEQAFPESITFPRGHAAGGTLHVSVTSSGVALLLDHCRSDILERINFYYGRKALSHMKIRVGHLRKRAIIQKSPPIPLSLEEKARLEDLTSGIADVSLKEVLGRLGHAIMSKRRG